MEGIAEATGFRDGQVWVQGKFETVTKSLEGKK